MICFPNAKINIGLNITEKRTDGFHNIETIFYPVQLNDVIEIHKSDKMTYENSGLLVDGGNGDKNIILKAYNLLSSDFELQPVNVHLHKIIPFGAGLGGGSSDGVFALKLFNSLFNLSLSEEKLYDYSKKLGSDCPFFIANKPCFASGKGDKLVPVEINLSNYYLVIVNPGIMVETAKAYSQITPCKITKSLKELINIPISLWRDVISNDFENVIFNNYPEIKNIKDKLYSEGAIYASMSGSGSSVFGIFESNNKPAISFSNYFVWSTKM